MALATLRTRRAFGQENRWLRPSSVLFIVLLVLKTALVLPGSSQPGIRFRLSHYLDTSVTSNLSADQRQVLKSRILPSVRDWLLHTITHVTRKDLDPIWVRSQCVSSRDELGDVFCDTRCAERTLCGHHVVPDEHLKCQTCVVGMEGCDQCQNCGVDHAHTGPGVLNTDYLLYVTAVNDSSCQASGAVYTSVACDQEKVHDRPIAGNINICPSGFSSSVVDFEYQVSLFLREMIGLLGFRKELFPYYRDSDGNPLTPRDDKHKPILESVLGQLTQLASTATIVVSETPWITATQSENVVRSQSDHLIVTPAVIREAQNHFGCDKLTGLSLESTGMRPFSFWNARLMLGELMTVHPQPGAVVSSITLALLEDTGWYRVNYTHAGHLPWGHKFGCTFANGSCLAYALENAAVVKNEQSLLSANWTTTVDVKQMQWGVVSEFVAAAAARNRVQNVSHSFPYSSVISSMESFTRCTYDHRFLARSNLNNYDSLLSPEFRYFTGVYDRTGSVSKSGWQQYGGTDEATGFCPYFQSIARPETYHRFHDCQNPFIPLEQNTFLEWHGIQSVCVNFASPWSYDNSLLISSDLDHISSGCYKIKCNMSSQMLSIFVMDVAYPCSHSGAIVNVHVVLSGVHVRGSFICPSYHIVCRQQTGCHNNCNNRGTCRNNSEGNDECVCFIGFSGRDCSDVTGYGHYMPTGSIVLPIHSTTRLPTTSAVPHDDGSVKWTARVIANFVLTFTATITIIFLLIWLFKCGGMQHGKMKGPPSRSQQREQRRLAQQASPNVIDSSNEVTTVSYSSSSYPPAYRVRPDGSQALYPLQVTIGPYSFTPAVDDSNDLVT